MKIKEKRLIDHGTYLLKIRPWFLAILESSEDTAASGTYLLRVETSLPRDLHGIPILSFRSLLKCHLPKEAFPDHTI